MRLLSGLSQGLESSSCTARTREHRASERVPQALLGHLTDRLLATPVQPSAPVLSFGDVRVSLGEKPLGTGWRCFSAAPHELGLVEQGSMPPVHIWNEVVLQAAGRNS